ncbi:MAG: HEAT repeat domain-containing protein [Candidatus Viridilinea halotolerans]|uniref:HEAT repeat domain-containing protein n=1 Tax=Candidatus Viridilinea halotolerans TaxID=2491704 RepID=A0A426UA27_9CHLR|nr:MAG: HEAT repeat domain-containing protein [Candidatus Viridilinea halotolerans]
MTTLETQLAPLGDLGRPLVHADLKLLAALDHEGLRVFLQLWHHFPAERRLAVVQELDQLSEDNVDLDFRSVLRACLSDSDQSVRAAAITGLWEDESEQTMNRLLALLDDEDGPVRAAAAVALARFVYRAEVGELPASTGQRLHDDLLRVATDPEQPLDVRRRAIEGLGYCANSSTAQAEIGRAYAHHELAMRESAILAMGRSMRPTWIPYIQRELQSPAPALRYEAARAVGELAEDGRPLLSALLPLVDDDDLEITLAAIWSLGQVGGPNAKRILTRLARSADLPRRQAAQDALAELSLEDIDP